MKLTKLILIFALMAGSVVANAETDFIKYKDRLIPVDKLDTTTPITPATTWSYPVAGVNYPSRNASLPTKNKAYDFISSRKCVPNSRTVRCDAISDQLDGGIMFVYRFGGYHNAFLASTYAKFLLLDCFGAPEQGTLEACEYFRQQMTYFERTKVVHTNFDTWHINTGLPDAMTQAQIAELYLIEKDYAKFVRAGVAFDTPLNQGGLAEVYNNNSYWYWAAGVDETVRRNSLNVHNKALLRIIRILETLRSPLYYGPQSEIAKWQTRLDRGVEALLSHVQIFDCDSQCSKGTDWSYGRTIPTKAEGSGAIGSTEGYHHLNHATLQRLIHNGYDRGGKLLDYCSRWKFRQLGSNCTATR